MAGPYGWDSAEAVAELEWLPNKTADRVANRFYRKMQRMNDGTEVEVVMRTYNAGKLGVLYRRACFKCGNESREPMATPGHVFCKRNECGGKKQESDNRARNAESKAKRDAQEPALLALMEKTGKKRAPEDATKAKYNVVYAGLNRLKDQQPYLCMRFGNHYSEACPCGKVKTACVTCTQMYGRRDVCSNCTKKKLDKKAIRDGKYLCATCEALFLANGDHVPGKTVTTEQRFFDAYLPLITHPDGSPWSPDQLDQRKDGGLGTRKTKKRGRECPTDTVAFPDCLHVRRNKQARITLAVVTECDEHSHSKSDYRPSCEAKKIDNTFVSLHKLGMHEFVPEDAKGYEHNDIFPVVFLRVNPDACHVKPPIKVADRVRVAASVANHYLHMPEDELAKLETKVPIVRCLYYHEEEGKRFLKHYERLNKKNWLYLGNACERAPASPRAGNNSEASCSSDPL